MSAVSSIGDRAKLLWKSGSAFCTFTLSPAAVPRSKPLTARAGYLQAWRNMRQYASGWTSMLVVADMVWFAAATAPWAALGSVLWCLGAALGRERQCSPRTYSNAAPSTSWIVMLLRAESENEPVN